MKAAAAILVLLVLILPHRAANAGVDFVWANDGGDKAMQEESRASNSTSVTNRIWDGTTITLFGARNEVVNFNLVLEVPTTPAT